MGKYSDVFNPKTPHFTLNKPDPLNHPSFQISPKTKLISNKAKDNKFHIRLKPKPASIVSESQNKENREVKSQTLSFL